MAKRYKRKAQTCAIRQNVNEAISHSLLTIPPTNAGMLDVGSIVGAEVFKANALHHKYNVERNLNKYKYYNRVRPLPISLSLPVGWSFGSLE